MADENSTAASQADATAREAASATAGAAQGAADAMRQGAQRTAQAFGQAGEAMRATGQKAAENSSAISLKMIDQAETNTHEAFEAMRRAAQAKDVSEVMRVQGDYLREQGCDAIQGNWLSPPLAEERCLALLLSRQVAARRLAQDATG